MGNATAAVFLIIQEENDSGNIDFCHSVEMNGTRFDYDTVSIKLFK